jgi:hypothetical protein
MSQAGTALGSAAGQNLASSFGGGTLHKAVFAAALAFLGLVSSLRHKDILPQNKT